MCDDYSDSSLQNKRPRRAKQRKEQVLSFGAENSLSTHAFEAAKDSLGWGDSHPAFDQLKGIQLVQLVSFPLSGELSLMSKINGMNCSLEVPFFFHQFKTKWDESILDYKNEWLWNTGFQVIREETHLSPKTHSWGYWAFLGNDFNVGSFLCRARALSHAKWKYSKRLWGRHTGMCCGIQYKRQAENISSMPWKKSVLHGPCGCEVPELLQEEKQELPCVWGWRTQKIPGTGRNSAVGMEVDWGLWGVPALPWCSASSAASSWQALLGNSSRNIGKNIVMYKRYIMKLACCQWTNRGCR